MASYVEIYKSLYRRPPGELLDLGDGWVLVNGARMTARELEQLTGQLQTEWQQERARKRGLVNRLLGWFGSSQP
jgi:hypothetical protein